MKWQDVTTREKVYEMIGMDPNCLPDVSMLPEAEAKDVINDLEFKRMIRAINTDENGKTWEPDYNNEDEEKISPWFRVDASDEQPAGFGLSGAYYVDWNADSDCGSRLCFQTPQQFYHAWEHFPDLFTRHHLILK